LWSWRAKFNSCSGKSNIGESNKHSNFLLDMLENWRILDEGSSSRKWGSFKLPNAFSKFSRLEIL